MLLVSVMGIKPKQEGASFDIVVVVDPLSKGNNATPFFSCANFFYSFSKFGFRLISYLYCHCFDRKHNYHSNKFQKKHEVFVCN